MAANTESESSTSTEPPAAKKYCAATAFIIHDIPAKFQDKQSFSSLPFACQTDPASPMFVVRVGFGTAEPEFYSVYIKSKTSHVSFTSVKARFFGPDWDSLQSSSFTQKLKPNIAWGWPQFFSRDAYLANESKGLRVVAEVEYEVPTIPPHENKQLSVQRFQSDFLAILENESSTDVTFKVEDEEIKAHKLILSARCDYFKNMFASGMKETERNEVKISDIESNVFKELQKFLYSGIPPPFREAISPGLLIAADKYGLDDLKMACESDLTKNLSTENVVDYLLLAYGHNCPRLLHSSMLTFRSHFDTLDKDELKKLNETPPLLLKLLQFDMGKS